MSLKIRSDCTTHEQSVQPLSEREQQSLEIFQARALANGQLRARRRDVHAEAVKTVALWASGDADLASPTVRRAIALLIGPADLLDW